MVGVKVGVTVLVWVAVGDWIGRVRVGEVKASGVAVRSMVAVGVSAERTRLAFHSAREPMQ